MSRIETVKACAKPADAAEEHPPWYVCTQREPQNVTYTEGEPKPVDRGPDDRGRNYTPMSAKSYFGSSQAQLTGQCPAPSRLPTALRTL